MGKSFVLRNESERAVGYIQQVGRTLRCGIHVSCGEPPFELYLLDASGDVNVKRMDDIRAPFVFPADVIHPFYIHIS